MTTLKPHTLKKALKKKVSGINITISVDLHLMAGVGLIALQCMFTIMRKDKQNKKIMKNLNKLNIENLRSFFIPLYSSSRYWDT